jgi:hypothetical protein
MTQRYVTHVMEVLQEEIKQVEAEQRDVELYLPTAKGILDLLEEAGYEGYEYFGS